jgi:hypothetical protein
MDLLFTPAFLSPLVRFFWGADITVSCGINIDGSHAIDCSGCNLAVIPTIVRKYKLFTSPAAPTVRARPSMASPSDMRRKGDCWDNALMESVWATCKGKCADRHIFAAQQEARAVLFAYLEIFYNRQRIHSSLSYQCPAEFEQSHVVSDSFKTA